MLGPNLRPAKFVKISQIRHTGKFYSCFSSSHQNKQFKLKKIFVFVNDKMKTRLSEINIKLDFLVLFSSSKWRITETVIGLNWEKQTIFLLRIIEKKHVIEHNLKADE